MLIRINSNGRTLLTFVETHYKVALEACNEDGQLLEGDAPLEISDKWTTLPFYLQRPPSPYTPAYRRCLAAPRVHQSAKHAAIPVCTYLYNYVLYTVK